MPITRALTPEDGELLRQRAVLITLESELADAELARATLSTELEYFDRSCRRRLAERYARLDELEARIAEARVAGRPADPKARDRARTARERARESAGRVPSPHEPDSPPRFKPSDALRSLYCRAVKCVHPDLATSIEDAERRHELMIAANDAYAQGDELRLCELLQGLEARAPVPSDATKTELAAVLGRIAGVRARQAVVRGELVILMRSDSYAFMLRVNEATSHGRDLIAETAAELDEEIRVAEGRLAEMRS